jgi:outer membrane receptor for ferrienterochelin and colicin
LLWAAGLLALALPALPQGVPTGTISGRVTDPQGLPLPGVTVSVSSPVLQGVRSAVSSANGDYIIPFLPAGTYEVKFEMSGFNIVKEQRPLAVNDSLQLNEKLALTTKTESITVTGEAPGNFTQNAAVASNYKMDLIEKLPLARTIADTLTVAPGVHSTGPSSNPSFSGAMSFEGVFMINGVEVQDNIRNTLLNLSVEDAIQEISITRSNVSAEYGRFSGGIANTITKSGGNDWSGSFRTSFTDDKWRALYPIETTDPRVAKLIPAYEATLGGPFIKDKLWFFGAGRSQDLQTSALTSTTLIPYIQETLQRRVEAKLTFSPTTKHTIKANYFHIQNDQTNARQQTIMDLASLYNGATPQDFFSANYTGIISPKFFVEAQFAERHFTFKGTGSPYTDLINGTLLIDGQRAQRYHTSTFCGVCRDENRDNTDLLLKGTYFLSTSSSGSHNLVFGLDAYNDQRAADNHQSGSDYRIQGTTTIIQGTTIYPQFLNDNSTILTWNPIFQTTEGNNFRTYSAFVNDTWRLNSRFTFNLGLRYDKNNGKDALGNKVVNDSAFSPRLSASWDPTGTGLWSVHAGYSKYVGAIANSIADAGTAGGQPANFSWNYKGPNINPPGTTSNFVGQDDAIRAVFAWFNANGGATMPLRSAPSVPGLVPVIADALKSPNAREVTLGFGRKLGSKANVRLDGMYRSFHDFYSDRTDTTTGKITGTVPAPVNATVTLDKRVRENTNDLKRDYKALEAQLDYRATSRVLLSASYTLSESNGNVDGENAGSGPVTGGINAYPEYFQTSWNLPIGDLFIDQRHKATLSAVWDVPLSARAGTLAISALERINSGSPYGAIGPVATQPYVTNPGYLGPPASVNYYFTARDAFRTDTITRTDMALNYSHKMGLKKAELFGRGRVINLFNQTGLADWNNINTTTQTRTGGTTTLQTFNPFTTAPVEGVNWQRGPTFGQASNTTAYQTSRTFDFSVGFRF